MACQPKFEKSIQLECVMEAAKEIIAGRMTVAVAQKILWAVGCATESFAGTEDDSLPPLIQRFGGEEPDGSTGFMADSLEAQARVFVDYHENTPPVASFADQASGAIDPATLAMLIQLGLQVMKFLADRRKNR